MIEAVLFDLDGTLFDRRSSFRGFVRNQMGRLPALFTDVDARDYLATLERLDRNGYAPKAEVFEAAASEFSLPAGASRTLLDDFEQNFPDTLTPMKGMVETLETLRALGLRTGLITNGRVMMQTRKIDGLGLRPLLHLIVISEALGLRKPHPGIFEHAVDALAVAPHEAVYVGDNPDADVAGSRDVGMISVWFRDPFYELPTDAHFVIDELTELAGIIGENKSASPTNPRSHRPP